MKTQHQIKFKRRRTGRPRSRGDIVAALKPGSIPADIAGAQVIVGERELQFARALSDTEKDVREAALSSLREFLSQHGKSLTPSELDRLWKGLFYCIWMADKRPIITATVRDVVDLMDAVGWTYMDALFRCLVREWFGVDKHRVDKYYELINAALQKCVAQVISAQSKGAFLRELGRLQQMLTDTIWKQAPQSGLGVALHFLDVYVDNLMRPVLLRGSKLPGNEVHKVFDALLSELYTKIGSCEGHLLAVGKRIQDRVLTRMVAVVEDASLELKLKDRRDMIMRVSKRIFAAAASKETSDDLRKGLYDLRTEMKAYVTICDAERSKRTGSNAVTTTKSQSDSEDAENHSQ